MSITADMSEDELKEYNRIQKAEIEKYKWLESEKAGNDLGQKCIVDWILNCAALFREKYMKEKELENSIKIKFLPDLIEIYKNAEKEECVELYYFSISVNKDNSLNFSTSTFGINLTKEYLNTVIKILEFFEKNNRLPNEEEFYVKE
jgi:hypothetical protein